MRRRRANLGRALFLVLVLLILVLGYLMQRTMGPVLLAFAVKQAEILGVEAVTRAIRTQVAEQVDYEDLIRIQRDDSGHVTFLQVNTVALSGILAGVEEAVLNSLRDLQGTTFDIPLGVVLGSDLFAAYGPPVKARLLTIGSPSVQLDQSFETAGINQTRHTIYLVVEARMRVLVPLLAEDTTVATRLPLVETVIVGRVPEQYLNLDWLWPRVPPGR